MISIIVPIFNGEKYLHRCIKSVLAQSYTNYELILINDGSTDSSLEICNHYASNDNRIVVLNQSNHGVSVARNNGLSSAKGDYITFIDCDDWIDEDYLQSLYDDIIENNVDLVVKGYREILENGTKGKDTNSLNLSQMLTIEKMKENLFVPNEFMSFCYPWSKLFKMSIIKDIKFRENISIGEDRLFIFEYLEKSSTVFCSSTSKYNYYINNEGAMNGEFNDKYLTCFDAMDILLYRSKQTNNNKLIQTVKREYGNMLLRLYKRFAEHPRGKNEIKKRMRRFIPQIINSPSKLLLKILIVSI